MVYKDYIRIHYRAVKKPLPELKKTFEAELSFFKKNIKKDFIVLDVGCGFGRPTIQLAPFVKTIIGIDHIKI